MPCEGRGVGQQGSLLRGDTICCAPQSTEQVAAFCRSLHEMSPSDSSPSPQDATSPQLATTRQLSDADKLRKVICELLETERTYVKVRLPPGSPASSATKPLSLPVSNPPPQHSPYLSLYTHTHTHTHPSRPYLPFLLLRKE
jgi:hypothetical protein